MGIGDILPYFKPIISIPNNTVPREWDSNQQKNNGSGHICVWEYLKYWVETALNRVPDVSLVESLRYIQHIKTTEHNSNKVMLVLLVFVFNSVPDSSKGRLNGILQQILSFLMEKKIALIPFSR